MVDDLDDFEGEDWRGRVFGGKYDNRYGDSRPYGSKKYTRKGSKRKKIGAIMILSLVAFAIIVYLEIPIPHFESKSIKAIQDIKNTINSKTELISNSEIYIQITQALTNIEKPDFIRTESGFNHTKVEQHIWDFTNQHRIEYGLTEISRTHEIDSIAREHSKDMATRGYFEHDSPEGNSPSDRGHLAGYQCLKDYGSYYTEGLAENIALDYTYSSYMTKGIPTSYNWLENERVLASQIVNGWMNSPGHRENILGSKYDKIGIGVFIADDESVFSTQNFC